MCGIRSPLILWLHPASAPRPPHHHHTTPHNHPTPHPPQHPPSLAPQAKDKLLELMSAQIAGEQEAALKRVLGEDEAVMKRREALTHKLDMLRRAQAELTSVDV